MTAPTFNEVQFPTDISYGSTGGPGFSTTVFESSGGQEQRNVNWLLPRAEYDVSQGIKTPDQMEDLLQFFVASRGKAFGFRFKDWSDYIVANQQIGVGTGSQTVFQLTRTYAAGSFNFTRPILKPVAGTLQTVTVSGAPVSATIDTTTGLITLAAAAAANAPVVVTYCEFDIPVRFDTDKMDISQDFFNTTSWGSIKLKELRL